MVLAIRFLGASRIAGKDALDLHEKELAIPVTIRPSLDNLFSIVFSFQLTGWHRPANPADDVAPAALWLFGKLNQSRDFAVMSVLRPLLPG